MATSNKQLAQKLNGQKQENGHKTATVADQVAVYLNKPEVREQMAMALPKHVTADRLSRMVVTNIRNTPALLECSMSSLVACTVQASSLGLEPGLTGHCYFVPFYNSKKGCKEAQFITGYKGLIDLARRTGSITTIAAAAIYSGDRFLYRKGFDEVLEHEPNFQDRGELIGFYAYAKTNDGGRYAEVMTLQDVAKIRARSKAKDSGPWVTDFEEMGKKTVLRRLCKYLPISIEVARTIKQDEETEFSSASTVELNLGSLPVTLPDVEVAPQAPPDTPEPEGDMHLEIDFDVDGGQEGLV